MFRLSVCADTLFLKLPFVERVKQIARAGFLVEFWRWSDRDIDAIAADANVEISAFTGYLKGCMVHPDGIEDLLDGIKASLPVAAKLRCNSLFLSSGELDNQGQVAHPIAQHPATKWISAYKTLCRVAEIAEKHNVVYCLEHLNTKVDHPRFPFPHVEDVARLSTKWQSADQDALRRLSHASRGRECGRNNTAVPSVLRTRSCGRCSRSP